MLNDPEGGVGVVQVDSSPLLLPFFHPVSPLFSFFTSSLFPGVSVLGRASSAAPAHPVILAQAEIYASHFKDFSLIITFIIILEIKS